MDPSGIFGAFGEGAPQFNTGLMALAAGGALLLAGLVVNAFKALVTSRVQKWVSAYPALTCLYPLPLLLFLAMDLRLASLVVALCGAAAYASIRWRGVRRIAPLWIGLQVLVYLLAYYGNQRYIEHRWQRENDEKQVFLVIPYQNLSAHAEQDLEDVLTEVLVEELDGIFEDAIETHMLPPLRTSKEIELADWRSADYRNEALAKLRLQSDLTLVNEFGAGDSLILSTRFEPTSQQGEEFAAFRRFDCAGSVRDQRYLVLGIAAEIAGAVLELHDEVSEEGQLELKLKVIQRYCRLARVDDERDSSFCDEVDATELPQEARDNLSQTTLGEIGRELAHCDDSPGQSDEKRQTLLAKLGWS